MDQCILWGSLVVVELYMNVGSRCREEAVSGGSTVDKCSMYTEGI